MTMPDLQLTEGTRADYLALKEHHYLAEAPVTMMRVLAVRDHRPTALGRYLKRRDETRVVGVLVESLPALSCRMRDEALDHRYGAHLPPSARAALLNEEVRCISRVVVHPQHRGLGLAVRLVRAALASATTRYTESLAAMGRVHPFFERAGMTAYPRPPHEWDARLLAALDRVGVPLGELSAPRVAALDADRRRFLDAELRRWHGRYGKRGGDPCRAAQRRLLFEPVYYLHDNADDVPARSA